MTALLHPKRQARELALQILFQIEFTPQIAHQDFLQLFETRFPGESIAYADDLINGVKEKSGEIDALVQAASPRWKMDRMALVDRNILRLAVFEMRFLNPPVKSSIVINEAVEIAKKFGTTESGAFVNGLLDQIRKESGWE